MNFDGTYKDTEKEDRAAKKLLESQGSEPQTPKPVRVIVSYPQSEEWDGTPRWRKTCCKIAIGLTAVIILAAAAGAGYYIFQLLRGNPETDTDFDLSEQTDPNYLKHYLINQVTIYYDNQRKLANRSQQLQFFIHEQERFGNQNLTVFINNLNVDIPAHIIPADEDKRQDVRDKIEEYIKKAKSWLAYVTNEESVLTSYEYQSEETLQARDETPTYLSAAELEELQTLRNEYTKPLEVIVDKENGSVYFLGQVLVLKKIVAMLKDPERFKFNIKQVTVASTIVYMDQNLTRNVDLAILAPEWHFKLPVYFDLSGTHAVSEDLDIKDGRAGVPGSDGGSFLAAGRLNHSMIHVHNVGGAGGPGHDGPNGRNGTANLSLEADSTTPYCVTPGNLNHINPANESIERFMVFPNGSCGEAGQAGGAAGPPGRGGYVIFMQPDRQTIEKGLDGAVAPDGVHGLDGVSAPALCHYNAYKITRPSASEKWDPITTLICNRIVTPPVIQNNMPSANTPNRNLPIRTPVAFSEAIAKFSNRARFRLAERNDRRMFSLLQIMEASPIIANMTSAKLLFEEYKAMDQFNHPIIFESFLSKIRQTLNANQSKEATVTLQYLQVAVWSKISLLRSGIGDYYIVDINQYIEHTLQTVKLLSANQLELVDDTKQQKDAMSTKLNEIHRAVSSFSDQLRKNITSNHVDTRIMTFVEAASKATSYLVQIANDTLMKHSAQETYEHLSQTWDLYLQKKRAYVLILPYNSTTMDYACAEMMISQEHCHASALERWESFRKMDEVVIAAFKIRQEDPFQDIGEIVGVVLAEVRERRAVTAEQRARIAELRSTLEDLAALLIRCRRIAQDAQLQQRVKQLRGVVISSDDSEIADSVTEMKKRILINLLQDQYSRAFFAYQQWAYPFTDTVTQVSNGATKEELEAAIYAIKDALSTHRTTISKRDELVMTAKFGLKSPTGPFYTWKRSAHKQEITHLLQGLQVQIQARLKDSGHVPLKQAIKFRMGHLELPGVPRRVLKNFAIEMIHSGFSQFFYSSSFYTAVGPQVLLHYGFDFSGGEPTVFNEPYKKIKNGDLMLSPFTTWKLTIRPVNKAANFQELQAYANATDLHLVGSGWYVAP